MIYKQKVAKALGEEGCYFLCLLRVAEDELGCDIDAIELYSQAVMNGWMREDCYVENPSAIMESLLGRRCSIRKSWNFSERLKESERDIWRYERKATGATWAHFVLMNADGTIRYDPLEDSATVRLGHPASRRILSIGEG